MKEKEKRKKDIYIYVLSAVNIADTLNMCVSVYIKEIVIFYCPPRDEVCSLCHQVGYFMFLFQLLSPHVILA